MTGVQTCALPISLKIFVSQSRYGAALEKNGNKFKPIHGIEAYFIPSLKEWEILREERENEKKEVKKQKKNNNIINDILYLQSN